MQLSACLIEPLAPDSGLAICRSASRFGPERTGHRTGPPGPVRTCEERGLLAGQKRGPRPGHQWGLLRGLGHLFRSRGRCRTTMIAEMRMGCCGGADWWRLISVRGFLSIPAAGATLSCGDRRRVDRDEREPRCERATPGPLRCRRTDGCHSRAQVGSAASWRSAAWRAAICGRMCRWHLLPGWGLVQPAEGTSAGS
jgi:hypothetical protein